jgi:hypothetical protein
MPNGVEALIIPKWATILKCPTTGALGDDLLEVIDPLA